MTFWWLKKPLDFSGSKVSVPVIIRHNSPNSQKSAGLIAILQLIAEGFGVFHQVKPKGSEWSVWESLGWCLEVLVCYDMGVSSSSWRYPKKILCFFCERGNPTKIRMISGGTPILGNFHMVSYGMVWYGMYYNHKIVSTTKYICDWKKTAGETSVFLGEVLGIEFSEVRARRHSSVEEIGSTRSPL